MFPALIIFYINLLSINSFAMVAKDLFLKRLQDRKTMLEDSVKEHKTLLESIQPDSASRGWKLLSSRAMQVFFFLLGLLFFLEFLLPNLGGPSMLGQLVPKADYLALNTDEFQNIRFTINILLVIGWLVSDYIVILIETSRHRLKKIHNTTDLVQKSIMLTENEAAMVEGLMLEYEMMKKREADQQEV